MPPQNSTLLVLETREGAQNREDEKNKTKNLLEKGWSTIKLRRSAFFFPQNSIILALETREGALNTDTAKNPPDKSRPLKSVKRAHSWKWETSKMKIKFQKLLLSWKRTFKETFL